MPHSPSSRRSSESGNERPSNSSDEEGSLRIVEKFTGDKACLSFNEEGRAVRKRASSGRIFQDKLNTEKNKSLRTNKHDKVNLNNGSDNDNSNIDKNHGGKSHNNDNDNNNNDDSNLQGDGNDTINYNKTKIRGKSTEDLSVTLTSCNNCHLVKVPDVSTNLEKQGSHVAIKRTRKPLKLIFKMSDSLGEASQEPAHNKTTESLVNTLIRDILVDVDHREVVKETLKMISVLEKGHKSMKDGDIALLYEPETSSDPRIVKVAKISDGVFRAIHINVTEKKISFSRKTEILQLTSVFCHGQIEIPKRKHRRQDEHVTRQLLLALKVLPEVFCAIFTSPQVIETLAEEGSIPKWVFGAGSENEDEKSPRNPEEKPSMEATTSKSGLQLGSRSNKKNGNSKRTNSNSKNNNNNASNNNNNSKSNSNNNNANNNNNNNSNNNGNKNNNANNNNNSNTNNNHDNNNNKNNNNANNNNNNSNNNSNDVNQNINSNMIDDDSMDDHHNINTTVQSVKLHEDVPSSRLTTRGKTVKFNEVHKKTRSGSVGKNTSGEEDNNRLNVENIVNDNDGEKSELNDSINDLVPDKKHSIFTIRVSRNVPQLLEVKDNDIYETEGKDMDKDSSRSSAKLDNLENPKKGKQAQYLTIHQLSLKILISVRFAWFIV